MADNAYDCKEFHPACPTCTVLDLGGFTYLWCPTCRVLVNMQAIATRLSYDQATISSTEAESG